uniref:Laminin subunit alpha-1 n=1 Tax=Vombatus ursinus TaxID=29139 RepID=A0A4X2M801_VOMUR
MSNAHISTNATCGEKGPEMFCKLVEHVPGRPVKNAQCRICDCNSASPKERHPISNAIDGTNNWWQSPSIQNGRKYHWVTITLDLRQVFQVAYIIIKAANAPRPGNWILERSLDGAEFTPWQYYAISDTECLTRYNVTPRLGPPTYKRDDEVICTSYYSRLVPLEHGEIHTSLINGRPSADDLSPKLLEFTSARYIRLRLQRIRTLNADLMTLSRRDPKDLDPIVTRRYYYSIKDISIGGMCICYGHASSCPWDETTKKLQCQCEHNTCGESCNECCPGFHQQPWRPGTISSGNTCEECNCHNKTKDCYYDQSVADQKKSMNIAGHFKGGGVCVNCLQNTAGINCETCIDGYYRPHKVSPYENSPCLPCNCDPLGSLSSVCVKDDRNWPGQCQCKEGYTGEKCDRCQFGYKGFPNCFRCNCSLAGSVNDDPCSEPCLCKKNVEGEECGRCKPGFYNLKERNPEGCTECFCFGVSDVCDSLSWPVTDMSGWQVTDLSSSSNIQSQQNQVDGPHQITINNTVAMQMLKSKYYWSAPIAYLGNKLTAFGGNLKYTVSYDIPMETVDSDLMSHTDGNGLTLSTRAEGLSLQPYEEYFNVVKLVPENFRDYNTKREIDRDQLMTVLANFKKSASVHVFLFAYRLDAVTLDIANPNVIDLVLATDAEYCECPQGYNGISCESCLPGYYRVGGILFGGICQPCECHGHATECDIHGACLACKHNTTGAHCDQCLPGFYGNPSSGTSEDCRPCACPLTTASNNFSPTCHLDDGDEVICDQCQPGYTGTWCERCADGYYGNPTVPGESCVPCDCSGNVDPLEIGHCDTVTGECLKCIGNTEGPHCERCADGFYGDALVAKNCHACSCHGSSSLSSICHHETGLCDCKPNVIGQHCDQCLNGYYGLNTGLGCLPCNCSQLGSLSENCSDEGQCHCGPGVAGQRCDRCAHGFYAYQDGSCTPCNCAHTHNTCDPESGDCICPPHTQGLKCENCEDEYWGHDPELGCKACNCSSIGSTSRRCDLLTGQCPCRQEYGSQSCNECALGFRGYPDCVSCDCEVSGTKRDACDEKQGVCSCEEETGTCFCKENVFGLHCSECKMGTFALHADNPLGCSPCFCSGMTHFCSELEGYVRIPITLTPDQSILRVVSQSNLEGTIEGVYYQHPEVLLDAATVRQHVKAEPFYWRLPNQFLGDQLMAYGGKLKYTVAFYSSDGIGTYNLEPQILIKGGRTSKLVIYMNIPAPENGVRKEQEVDMKENIWKYFNSVSEKSVTRSDFMSVLSNIDYILIKASYGQGLIQSRIANISIEIGVKAEEMHSNREVAYLLENCDCPPGFTGFSCQDCAPGYHRAKLPEAGVSEPRPLIAPCVPCHCNNHTETCHPETGKCLNCRDNTAGDHCNVCAPGHYGKILGFVDDCSLCACPRINASFSPTCVLEGDNDFQCNACSLGYEGQYCEKCSSGFYGNPLKVGGSCQPCDCDPNGSVHSFCNATSGQCICKPGVTGRACDECEPRHILVESKCVSCDDECVGVLLNDLDNITNAISSVNLTGIIPVPHGILSNLENATKSLRVGTIVMNTNENSWTRNTDILIHQLYNYQKPQRDLKELKEKANNHFLEYSNKLQEAQALVNEADAKTKETNRLLLIITTNLEELNVSMTVLVERKVKEMKTQANLLFDRLKPLKMLEENLNRNLSEIKELISQARKQAASIKVAVSADRDCIRAYQPQISSTNYNTLMLNVKTSEPDNLLFYLGSSASSDFLAVEMRHGKVAFLWDVGSGSARLEFSDFSIDNNKWHRIYITRFGNTGSLSIKEMSSTQKPLTKTAKSPGTANVLDVNESTLMFVGGLGGQIKKSPAVKVTHFKGCMGEASLNGKSIGLWNYIEREGKCNGCFGSSQNEDSSFYFDGSGYSIVEKTLRSTVTQIIMLFSTFSPNGLLLYLASNGTRDFLSIELVEGKVKLTVDLGSGPLALITDRRYNNGTWFKIAFQRNKKQGKKYYAWTGMNVLPIRSISILNNGYIELPPKPLSTESELMATFATKNSSGIILAGLSKGKDKRSRRQAHVVSYLKYYGIFLLCYKSSTLPTYSSYKEIKFTLLLTLSCCSPTRLSVQLTIRTFASSGLIYYMAHQNQIDYATLQLHEGQLYFMFDLGKGRTKAFHPAFVSDGKWHTVSTRTSVSTSPKFHSLQQISTPLFYLNRNKFLTCYVNKLKRSELHLLSNPISASSVNKCYTMAQEGTFFEGSGFVGYKVRSDVNITLEFRTTAMNGVLLGISSAKVDAIGIEMVNGKVSFHVNNGAGRITATYEPKSASSLCDGKWHKLQAHKSKHRIVLVVDGKAIPAESPHSQSTSADTNNPIYVGGYPADTKQNCLSSRTSFRGCMRKLTLIKGQQVESIDFSKAFDLRGVFPHSCPGTEL